MKLITFFTLLIISLSGFTQQINFSTKEHAMLYKRDNETKQEFNEKVLLDYRSLKNRELHMWKSTDVQVQGNKIRLRWADTRSEMTFNVKLVTTEKEAESGITLRDYDVIGHPSAKRIILTWNGSRGSLFFFHSKPTEYYCVTYY